MQVVIPMTGRGTRFQNAGYPLPKPMIAINEKTIIERLLESLPLQWPVTFIVNQEHKDTGLLELLKKLRPEAKVHLHPFPEKGPGESLLNHVDDLIPDEPVLVSYCDYGQSWDAMGFTQFTKQSDCDCALVCYRGFHAHYLSPMTYAYARLEGERVVEVKEKGSFTSHRENEFASTGGYYFKSPSLLKTALQLQFQKGLFMNGESYTSLTIQALLENNPSTDVRVFEVWSFFQWGTPNDLETYAYWENCFRKKLRQTHKQASTEQILMPMAGKGSRFAELEDTPKPFLTLHGRAMFLEALASLPRAKSRRTLVTLKEHETYLKNLETQSDPGFEVLALAQTPPGQALSTLEGLKQLDPEKSVFISACDHGVIIDPELWQASQEDPSVEGIIFTMTGYPGALRRPTAFAYVVDENPGGQSRLKSVRDVSVKQPISSSPQKDPLLVGTFWFRHTGRLIAAIEVLQKKDIRTNGELYLDSVFKVLLEQNKKVMSFPLDAYFCWGDPDSLAEYLYWHEVFHGVRIDARPRFPGLTSMHKHQGAFL